MLRSSGARRQSLAVIKTFGAFIGLFIGALFTLFAIHQYRGDETTSQEVEQQLHALATPWAADLADSQQRYREWFAAHGTRTEAMVFDDISITLLRSVLSIATSDENEGKLSFFSSIYIALHTGLIRVIFVALAMVRLVLVIIAAAAFYGLRSYRAYVGNDLLGQSGNGRVFYSGVRVGLDNVTEDGAPDLLLRGLACPQLSTATEATATELWKLLEEFNAANETNQALVAILLKNRSVMPYVAYPDEEVLLAQWFGGSDLLDNATALLRKVLILHGVYSAGDIRSELPPGAMQGHIDHTAPSMPMSSEDYAAVVQLALHRVLRADTRQVLGALSTAELATTVLSYECGKVLAYSFEGGKWTRKSNYSHLSARAVLHSVAEYPEDYPYDVRNRIRRALVYASRHSAFAPVRMPIDMTEDTWALRQWMEVLTSAPHELHSLCDEIELVGLVRSSHNNWLQEFLDGAVAFKPEIARNSFATPSNLMFVPLARLVELVRRSVNPVELRRLEELSSQVSTRQRLKFAEAQSSDGDVADGPSAERVYPPLTDQEYQSLTTLHGLDLDDLRDWAAFRVVLMSYGWLARRVGDYTVPESSVIFSVFKAEGNHDDANGLGLIGRRGMVPIRGSRLEDRWGRQWAQRFTLVASATMAESSEDFEKLLKGIDDRGEDDILNGATPAIA